MENININCPLCKKQAYLLFVKNSCEIFRCKSCAYEFTQIDKSLKHVHSVYGDDYLVVEIRVTPTIGKMRNY